MASKRVSAAPANAAVETRASCADSAAASSRRFMDWAACTKASIFASRTRAWLADAAVWRGLVTPAEGAGRSVAGLVAVPAAVPDVQIQAVGRGEGREQVLDDAHRVLLL